MPENAQVLPASALRFHMIKLIVYDCTSWLDQVAVSPALTSCHVGHRTAAPGRQRIEPVVQDGSGIFVSCFTTLRIGASFLVKSQDSDAVSQNKPRDRWAKRST